MSLPADAVCAPLAVNTTTQTRQQTHVHEQRAFHDMLTGLPNRDRFETRLRDTLALARMDRVSAAIMFIDLDHFRGLNERYGHVAGDAVLKAVAARLQRCVRADDLVARVGGDEFALLLLNLENTSAATRLAAQIEESLQLPIFVGSGSSGTESKGTESTSNEFVQVSAAVAVAHVPEDGTDMLTLLRHADAEMVRIKSQRTELTPSPT